MIMKNPLTEEEKRLIRNMVRQDMAPNYIATILDRPESKVRSYIRRRNRMLAGFRKLPAEEKSRIPCLRCRHDFDSEGSHNRLCPVCGRLGDNAPEYFCDTPTKDRGRPVQPIKIKSIEVLCCAAAPWAPVVPGFKPDWAWRVTTSNGNVVTGSCRGNKEDAASKAKTAAQRMAAVDGKCLPFVVIGKSDIRGKEAAV